MCDLSREEGFAIQTLHELGHYEAFRQGLNYRDEDVAWNVAESIARRVYGDTMPDYWSRVRREVQAKERLFWEKLQKKFEQEHQMLTE